MIKQSHQNDDFLQRLNQIIKKIGGNKESAEIIGKSVKSIERYKKGGDISFDDAQKLTKAAGVSLSWLAGNARQTPHGFSDLTNHNQQSHDFDYPKDFKDRYTSIKETQSHVSIPVMDITASAGHGSIPISEEQTSVIQFDRSYLHNTWNLNANDLFTINTIGESMEPTIKAGEYLLVSKSEEHMKLADGIFVIRLDGNILVKRIQILPGKKVFISSDNSAYTPYEINLDDGVDFHIVGKVVLVHGVRKV